MMIKKAVLAMLMLVLPASVLSDTDCEFTDPKLRGQMMTKVLKSDCTTDETIFIGDGITLDGQGHTISAVDPDSSHFVGAVIQNEGTTAHVKHLTVTTSGLVNACKGGVDRLRGIMFEGASGTIMNSNVKNINKGASGCQEGNGIEVRNAPFDGTHPDTKKVEIAHNVVSDWQKTGIVANGDVEVNIHHNHVPHSAAEENLAANSIQIGFGAKGTVTHNRVEGNQWKGTSNYAASGILVYLAEGGTEVSQNKIGGNSDVALFIISNNGLYEENHIVDEGDDHVNSGYDIGIYSYGVGNTFNKNHVRNFDYNFDPELPGEKNKALPATP